MYIVKSTLYFNANTVEKGNISTVLMEVIGTKDDNLIIADTNVGGTEELPKTFENTFFLEEDSASLLRARMFYEIKEGEDTLKCFFKNEMRLKKRALRHIKDTVLMYKELYKNLRKMVEKYDIRKVYDKDELKEWGK